MKSSEFISITDCCLLLGVTRPTFIHRREEVNLRAYPKGSSIRFNKLEFLNKLYSREVQPQSTINLISFDTSYSLDALLVDEYTLDLRKINLIDPLGVISLLCYSTVRLKNGHNMFFLIPDSKAGAYLAAVGFFKELNRKYINLVHWDKSLVAKLETQTSGLSDIYLPLKEITIIGQERKLLDALLQELLTKGFSEGQAGYIGWIIGELADNSLTHAKGPCYIMFSRYPTASGETFLEISVSDIGVGIETSLLNNKKYESLSRKEAFLKAFQSKVSCWPDEAKRGKGLCDLLTIALGNGGLVRVDSNDLGLFFNFTANQRSCEFCSPLSKVNGTKFSILLYEKDFTGAHRNDIDIFIETELSRK